MVTLPRATPAQQKVIDSKARFRVLMAGRRFGKSVIVQRLTIERMLQGQFCAYLCPDFSLASDFFEDIIDIIPEELIKSANKSRLKITLVTGGTLRFFSGEGNALRKFRSKKFHWLVIDECAFIPKLQTEYNKTIRPTLTDFEGEAIFISTPNGLDFFNSLYEKGLQGIDDFESFHYTSYDNPHLKVSEIEKAKSELPEQVFIQEYMAVPQSASDNIFGRHIEPNTIKELSNKPAVCYGIDLAFTADGDYTCIVGLDSDGVMSEFHHYKSDWQESKRRILALPAHINKVVDSTGVGIVPFQDLSKEGHNFIQYQFTSKSKPELIYSYAKAVENGEVKFNEVISREMKTYEYKRNVVTGNYSFNAKSGYFDDALIATALAVFCHKKYIAANSWRLYTA